MIRISIAALTLLLLAVGNASAASIGVNFNRPSFATDNLAASDLAGAPPFAQTNFNNIQVAVTNFVLNNNSGAATTATLTTSGAGFSSFSNSAVSGSDERLNFGAGLSGSDWSFTVSNITYASYSLVVYDLGFGGDVKGITAGGTTFYTSSPDPFSEGYLDNDPLTPYIYTPSVSTDSALPTPESNYVVFPVLSGASQTVTISRISGTSARYGGDFQIVEIPEPATSTTMLFGLAGLLACRRRRA